MAWILSAFADEAGEDMDTQIEALQTAGIDHIDLRVVDGINICDLPIDHAEKVAKKLEAANIKVWMYGSPIGKIDIADDFAIDAKKLEHLGELKAIFSTPAVRLFSYYNKKNPVDAAAWQAEALDRMKRLIEIANRCDLVLYHENEAGIFGCHFKDVAVLRDECRAVDPDHFKMIFDFDNYNHCGDDVLEAWRELGDTTDAVHFKESKKQADGKYQHVPVGTGDGHVLEILQDLAQRGWEGNFTLEPHLKHSAAVMSTGPSGQQNQALNDMTAPECFQIAAEAAIGLMKQVGKR